MNDHTLPAQKGEKICSNCLRQLPRKYFLKDGSRKDQLSCNCISCLFPQSAAWKSKLPDLWNLKQFAKIDESQLPWFDKCQAMRERLSAKRNQRTERAKAAESGDSLKRWEV